MSVIANLYKKLQKEPYWLTSIVVTGLILGLKQVGGLQVLELYAFDRMVRLQSDQGPDPRLLVVEVTEEDIRNQSEWPLPDKTMAELLETLQSGNPNAIGVDIYRDIPHGIGQAALARELQKPNVVSITGLGISADDAIPPPPNLDSSQIGFNDFPIDPDGILRRGLLYAEVENERLYSFALQLSLKYLDKDYWSDKADIFSVSGDSLQIGGADFETLSPTDGGYEKIDPRGYQMLLDYRSSNWVARKVTLTQALSGEIDPAWIEDKVVLIGVTAPSMKDFFYTPYSSEKNDEHVMSGVLVHAQIVSQILSTVLDEQPLFWFFPQGIEVLWVLGWSLAGATVVWRWKRSAFLGAVIVTELGVLSGLCLLALTFTVWIPFAAPVLALLLASGSLITYQVFYQSFYDSLTGLPSRSLFVRQLKQLILNSNRTDVHTSSAILLLDVDHFKAINESLGHQFGDQLLIEAASRIKTQLPSHAKLARIGGDEFAILLQNLQEASEVRRVADALYNCLTEPFKIDKQQITTSFSIGIALNQVQNASEAETLMQDAHRAMARARASGKEHYEIFDPGMRAEAVKRFRLGAELREAIDNQEFLLYYQPIINLKTRKLAGFEALVRWQHPTKGFVSPGAFIPAAEDTGLIVPMGSWILEEACQQMQQWQEDFPHAKDMMVSVNLSTKQFNQENLSEEVEHILNKTGLNSQSLKLELTESAAMEDVNGTIEQLIKLKTLNLKLSLDDFGTGYSSLSYLHQLPTDTLKVDQSFVGRMEEKSGEDGEIVKTIISLGHQLGMDVIAEGIETVEQLNGLRKLNCNYGQGYFFAKPLPKEEAAVLVAENKEWMDDWTSEAA
ncbi:MAG: EAL domain-containing protein [Phormidesmis sp.]